jgi:hypothetical protein
VFPGVILKARVLPKAAYAFPGQAVDNLTLWSSQFWKRRPIVVSRFKVLTLAGRVSNLAKEKQ